MYTSGKVLNFFIDNLISQSQIQNIQAYIFIVFGARLRGSPMKTSKAEKNGYKIN